MLDKLSNIKDKYMRLEEQLSDPEILSDMTRFTKVNKEYKELKPIIEKFDEYESLIGNIQTAKTMASDSDPELREMAKMELQELEPLVSPMEEEIKMLLAPKDPDDTKDVIFEIRSGTGGDEACLFVGDLYKMYSRYFEKNGWKVNSIAINEGSLGGYNKLIFEINGDNVYGKLKFESGAHRVQRVPDTESKGRVHTSAATVAVIPKFEEEEIEINKADLRVDTFRASGAGGQHVNKTESGIRITHIPTGVVAESTEDRSQHRNRDIAMNRLYLEIRDNAQRKFNNEQAAKRKSLVGSGDRSDKIRTYNFPQNRVTDHRIDLTLYKLDTILMGEIDEIIDALILYENTTRLQEVEGI